MDAWDIVRLRTASTHWNVPGKYGPHGELLFFLIQKEPAIVPNSEAFNIGDGFQVPQLKGESEASVGYQAGNVNNEALHVIGLHGSGDNISLPAGLGLGKGGIKLSQGPGPLVPGNVRCGKETWLVWVLSGLAAFFLVSFVGVCTPCAFLKRTLSFKCALVFVG